MDPFGVVKDQVQQDIQDQQQASQNGNLNFNGNRFSLNLNSLSSASVQSHPYQTGATGATRKRDFFVPINQINQADDVVAPPPPGFVDDTDQYYLPDDQGEDDRNSGQFIFEMNLNMSHS